ncbi:MAG: winged helix-turn-helix transcriptional regulator [Clostridia bacterium]|nr:winged helix-turn-helix transcriptional regulator [Clostridia bacterium]
MDICIVTNDALLARFMILELAEACYEAFSSNAPVDARLYICDLDFTCEVPEGALGFSYDEEKRGMVHSFLQRPINADKLRNAVSKRLSEPFALRNTLVEIDRTSRKAKSDKGEVRLSEKELALLDMLCKVPLLSRDDGAKIFGDGESNIVDVYMHYLRKKLAKVCDGETVKSRRGAGYSLSDTISFKFT